MIRTLRDVKARLHVKDYGMPPDDVTVGHITHDSRKVIPGTIFVCIKGLHVDGHAFAAEALKKGAVAVIAEHEVTVPSTVPVLIVNDAKKASEEIAPWFYGEPGLLLRMVGVTGTNGKTTTTHILHEMLNRAGKQAGLLGTIHALIGDETVPVQNTTPDVVELQTLLARMQSSGMSHAVMEVSSHALALGRVMGCEFDTAVFTNITQDHLDFHGTQENYRLAKALLFENLMGSDSKKTGKTAVVNIDDPAGEFMLAHTTAEHLTYAVHRPAAIRAVDVKIEAEGARFRLTGAVGDFSVQAKLTGFFNVYNLMAAAGAAFAEGVPAEIIRGVMESFQRVPGRFERLQIEAPFDVIIDYAHTPDGLENVLRTAREFVKGRLIVVFGCGGDRDRTKRPIMGRIAAHYADQVIVTSDNPRSEDPEQIIAEIIMGIQERMTPVPYEKITDRRSAIARALTMAKAGDLILIAGKGHENYQILGNRTIHFDDREVTLELLEDLR